MTKEQVIEQIALTPTEIYQVMLGAQRELCEATGCNWFGKPDYCCPDYPIPDSCPALSGGNTGLLSLQISQFNEKLCKAQINKAFNHVIGTRPCPECRGKGWVRNDDCSTCSGTGSVPITIEDAIEEVLKGEGK